MSKKYYCKTANDVIACRKKHFPEDVGRCSNWIDNVYFVERINLMWAVVICWRNLNLIADWEKLDWTEILFNNKYDL